MTNNLPSQSSMWRASLELCQKLEWSNRLFGDLIALREAKMIIEDCNGLVGRLCIFCEEPCHSRKNSGRSNGIGSGTMKSCQEAL